MKKRSGIQKRNEQLSNSILKLSKETPMLPGTFGTVFVKCGYASCWCANDTGKAHPFNRITWSDNGKSRTKAIPEKDIPWIKEVTKNYRNFKKSKRDLKILQAKLKLEIDKWERQLVLKTRKTKEYFKNL